MKRLCVLFCAVFFCLGCAAEDQGKWNEFWKDARGDNMQMRGFSGRDGMESQGAPKPLN
jgi:hypothetical protein